MKISYTTGTSEDGDPYEMTCVNLQGGCDEFASECWNFPGHLTEDEALAEIAEARGQTVEEIRKIERVN